MLHDDLPIITSLDDRFAEICAMDPRIIVFLSGLELPDSAIKTLPRRHIGSRHERDVVAVFHGEDGVVYICHIEWLSTTRYAIRVRMLRYGTEAVAEADADDFRLVQTALYLRRTRNMPHKVRWPEAEPWLDYRVVALDDFVAHDVLKNAPPLACALVPGMTGGATPPALRESLKRLSRLEYGPGERVRVLALHRMLAELSSVDPEDWSRIAMAIGPQATSLLREDPIVDMLAQIRERSRQKGVVANQLEVARRMLERGYDPQEVIEICGLSPEQLEGLVD